MQKLKCKLEVPVCGRFSPSLCYELRPFVSDKRCTRAYFLTSEYRGFFFQVLSAISEIIQYNK